MAEDGFFQGVYRIVGRIPTGKVASYSQIALMLGRPRGARIVGFAMRAAPGGLPCHRVVRATGELAPGDIFGGPGFQRTALEREGISFLPDGRIDMYRCQWRP